MSPLAAAMKRGRVEQPPVGVQFYSPKTISSDEEEEEEEEVHPSSKTISSNEEEEEEEEVHPSSKK